MTSENKDKRMDAKFVTRHRTKASTFAIPAKAPRKAKIAKELAFLAPHLDTFYRLETFDNKTINK